MVSNRHVYQLVAIVTSVLNCGLCSLWAAIKENMLPFKEGREQGCEVFVILERTLSINTRHCVTESDWVFLHMCESVGTVYSVYTTVQKWVYGAALLSIMVRRCSVGSASACCKAGPSSILGSAPQGGFSHWAYKRWRNVLYVCIVWMWLNERMYVCYKIWKINKESGIMPPNLW
jgi:hypothetical protein